MRYEIVGKNIEVTEGIRDAVRSSLDELVKYFAEKDIVAKVLVRTYSVGQKVEVTLVIDSGHSIRQEVTHDDLYAAIDLVGKKLEKQIRRMKERISTSKRQSKSVSEVFAPAFEKEEEILRQVTRRKSLSNKPMTEEEAILQFELSGHDFFVFEDFEVEIIKVLYKRKDGEYGIIELES